ncbi:hypothetical protein ACFX2F_006805 [Malus domestica]
MDRQIGASNGSAAISQITVGSRGAPPLYLQMISEALPLAAQPLAGGVLFVDEDEFTESLSQENAERRGPQKEGFGDFPLHTN